MEERGSEDEKAAFAKALVRTGMSPVQFSVIRVSGYKASVSPQMFSKIVVVLLVEIKKKKTSSVSGSVQSRGKGVPGV